MNQQSLLDPKVARKVIDHCLARGADFADVFVERTTGQNVTYQSSRVRDIQSGTKFGIGIRVIFGQHSLYGYTNLSDQEELLRIADTLTAKDKKDPSAKSMNFETFIAPSLSLWQDRSLLLPEKIETLTKFDQMLRAGSEHVHQVNLNLIQKNQWIEVFDSAGLHARDFRPYVRLGSTCLVSEGNAQSSAFEGPGARGGWSFIENINLEELSERLVKRALTTLHARPCPAGTMPVVIAPGFGGVIFHEACGHLLETTSVQKKASVFWDKKGEKIAHEAVSAVDDGMISKEWGSLPIDDEGMLTQKTQLIKNGVLTNFMCDRMGEIKTGHPRTGSARRESYKYAPASRMRNTYIEPGKASLDELLDQMGDGIYAKAMGGGSVNPGTGEFNFAVQEGYLVEGGKIQDAVKGATLIGRGEDIMTKISKVGTDLSFAAGMCGSVSGSLPVTVGQPSILVDEILVGGNA